MGVSIPLEQRFWAKVNKTKTCWLWTATKCSGYGNIWVNGKNVPAHRVSLFLLNIDIPKGMVVDHICRIRACVNPDHLRIVDMKTNALENSVSPVAINNKRITCKNGHLFDRINKCNGRLYRSCRACHNAASQKHKAKLKKKPNVTI